MEVTSTFADADCWLDKKEDVVEPACGGPLPPAVVDVGGLLSDGPVEAADTEHQHQQPVTAAAAAPFRVTMYQCAQCQSTFNTLDMCVSHQCLGPTADSCQSPASHHSLPLTDSGALPSNYRWGQHDTKTLLEILGDSVTKFTNPNLKRKFIWKEIADQLLEKGFNISQLQCENRWKTLKAMHRKSSVKGSTPAFFREMCVLAREHPELMSDGPTLGGSGRALAADKPAITSKVWSREASLTLLSLLKARHIEFCDPSIKRRSLWSQIAEAMNNLNMDYSPDQCEGRMKTLLHAYKRAQVRWQVSGEEVESDCYFQVDELVRLIPEFGSATASSRAAAADEPQLVRPARRRRGTGPQRVRRQRHLLSWLERWLQQQRSWDEAMAGVLRQQHAERLRVLTEIRDEVRTGGGRIPVTRPPPPPPPPPQPPPPMTHNDNGDDPLVAQVFIA